MNENFYDFSAKDLNEREVKMKDFEGKVVLVVNTASKCGLTPQYKGLQELYNKYKEQGLEILGFPCNQFANQEPGEKEDIEKVCYINYGVSFRMFSKIKVNGEDAHPLFKYLKSKLKGSLGSKIKWNFTKFLVDRKGNPIKRFAPTTKPEKLEEDIKALLSQEN